jgi:hypothetical protein
MATQNGVITTPIYDGPGDFDLAASLFRGEICTITLGFPDAQKSCRVKVESIRTNGGKSNFLLGGQIDLAGKWTRFSDMQYSSRARTGNFSLSQTEEPHPVCGHMVPIGARFCPQCNSDRMCPG